MSKVKVAIIGCGGIANQKHFPALKDSGRVRSSGRTGDSRLPRGTGKSGS